MCFILFYNVQSTPENSCNYLINDSDFQLFNGTPFVTYKNLAMVICQPRVLTKIMPLVASLTN